MILFQKLENERSLILFNKIRSWPTELILPLEFQNGFLK